MKSKIMMRGLLMLSLGASVCLPQTPFENKMTVNDNMQIKVKEAVKQESVATDELFTATQVPTTFADGLTALNFGAFADATPGTPGTPGTPMKPTSAINTGAVDEVANFVLGLYGKEGTSRAGILNAIVVLFKQILYDNLDRLNTAEVNASFEAGAFFNAIVTGIVRDLNNDIAYAGIGDATTQEAANLKSARNQAKQIVSSMLNKRIELVKPADEARQALEAAKLNLLTLSSGLDSLNNENCSSFITPAAPTAPAENAVQTMTRAVKELWANYALIRYASYAIAVSFIFVAISVISTQSYNVYAIGHNINYNLRGSFKA